MANFHENVKLLKKEKDQSKEEGPLKLQARCCTLCPVSRALTVRGIHQHQHKTLSIILKFCRRQPHYALEKHKNPPL